MNYIFDMTSLPGDAWRGRGRLRAWRAAAKARSRRTEDALPLEDQEPDEVELLLMQYCTQRGDA